MCDAESISKGLRISSSILLILSFLNTKNPSSLKRGTWISLISVITGVIASNPSEFIYLLPSLAAGLVVGLILGKLVSMKNLPVYLSLGFLLISSFVTYTCVLVFFTLQESSWIIRAPFTVGLFLSCQSSSGSLVTFGKLTKVIPSRQFYVFGWFRHILNLLIFSGVICVQVIYESDLISDQQFLISQLALSILFGLHTNLAVGFCDVCLLLPLMSSYMGFAIAALGIISLDNLLIISGSLLGTSSLILGFRLAKVIYRNLISVMLCSFSQGISEETTYPSFKAYETVSSQELIKQVKISSNILVVPGYGVIKSGCEGKIVEFFNILQGTGKNIMMCIHPVAGRLPGHLDLVFQEAGLDPKFIQSVEESNQKMKETDLVITIGANDIINPGAIDYSNSALGGFPVIRVWESKSSVIFLPRPDSLGFCRQNLTLSEKPKVRFMYADANILLMGMLREAKSRKHSLIRYNPLDASNEPEVIQMMDYPKPFLSIGVPRETEHLEKRVAMTPSMVSKFRMLGFRVYVQAGAGRAAGFFDEEYEKNDAQVVDEESVWDNDVILKIQKPSNEEFELLSSVKLVVSYVYPSKCSNFLDKISKRYPKLTYIAMDLVPKSNRGQSVDSVKLMQSIEGYRAIIEAFIAFDRSPKPMITAAGKLPPAQVVILGTDVAGISAVSYSKSLGCVTSAVDTRSIHKDEIEKLHASFITSKPAAEGEDPRKLFHETLKTTLKNSDIVICTSLIHNYEKIVDDVLIHEMKPGSILVDVYGNLCSKTVRDNQVVSKNGVKILHFSDLTSRMAPQASEFYSTCLYNIFLEIYNGEQLKMNELDDLVGSMMVVKEGRMLWYSRPPVSPITALVHTGKIAFRLSFPPEQDTSESFWRKLDFLWISAALAAYIITFSFISSFHKDWDIIMENFLVLVLALIIGWIIFRNTSTIYYANLIARAVGVTGIVLAVAFRYWKNLDVFGVVVASSLTFGFAFSFCFVFGIAFKTCEQYKEVTKKVLKIG